MSKLFLVAVLITVLSISVTSATKTEKIDSLENVLNKHTANDTVKATLLNKIASQIYKTDEEKARNYLKQAHILSDSLNFLKGKANSFYVEGSINTRYSDTLALECFLKALKIVQEANLKPQTIACLIAAGIKYANTGHVLKAIECYDKAQLIAEELDNKENIATCLLNRSVIYTGLGNYEKAIEDYQKALTITEETDTPKKRCTIYLNMGCIQQYQGNHAKALDYFYKSLELSEEVNYEVGILNAFLNIGAIHLSQAEYEKALELHKKALEIAEKLNNKRKVSLCYQAIGETYMATGDPKALEYLLKALEIAEGLYYITAMLDSSKTIGEFYRTAANYEKALEYYGKALVLAEELHRQRVICEIWYKTGSIHLIRKEYAKALNITLESLKIAQEINLLTSQRDNHNQLSDIYAATNNFEKAYINHKRYKELSDSVSKEENVKKIIELEYTYKFDKEKHAIELEQQKKDVINLAERKQQRVAIFSLLVVLILISIFAAYIFRSNRSKQRTNAILTKQKAEIEELNEEYLALNEEITQSNEQLYHANEIIEERENLLTQITDNVPVFISLVNNNLEYEFANNGYARIFNYEKQDVLGKKVNQVLDKNTYETAFPNLIKSMEGEAMSFENVLEFKDGQQRFIHTNYKPYEFHNGIQGVLVCSFDITERKKTEQKIREIEEEKKRLLALEMERINQELESNQKSMTAATLKLIQNAERDSQTIEQLMDIKKNTNADGKQSINTLISDYKRTSYNSNWDEFEILFEKTHSSFYEKLIELYPDLTTNERKICAFLKLNMSNKDISQITFQSDDALKKARMRLRQKLDIDRETNLGAFIQGI